VLKSLQELEQLQAQFVKSQQAEKQKRSAKKVQSSTLSRVLELLQVARLTDSPSGASALADLLLQRSDGTGAAALEHALKYTSDSDSEFAPGWTYRSVSVVVTQYLGGSAVQSGATASAQAASPEPVEHIPESPVVPAQGTEPAQTGETHSIGEWASATDEVSAQSTETAGEGASNGWGDQPASGWASADFSAGVTEEGGDQSEQFTQQRRQRGRGGSRGSRGGFSGRGGSEGGEGFRGGRGGYRGRGGVGFSPRGDRENGQGFRGRGRGRGEPRGDRGERGERGGYRGGRGGNAPHTDAQ